MTGAQTALVSNALGPDVLRVASKIEELTESGLTVPDSLWHDLLTAIRNDSPGLLDTIPGRVFCFLIHEKTGDAPVKSGNGFYEDGPF